MKVVTAPNRVMVEETDIQIFLAGGITNCPEWQDVVIAKLEDTPGVLYNPRRKNFPIHDPGAAQEQIRWEFEHLEKADLFSIWFCNAPSDQPICMYELGRNLARFEHSNLPGFVVVGVEPGYRREQDVYHQVRNAQGPSFPICQSLDEFVNEIRGVIHDWGMG